MSQIIKVNFTNRHGVVGTYPMQLEHYLLAAKAKPGQYEPADEESKKIAESVSLEKVDIGTTEEDVKEFERKRGKIKTKKTSQFDELLKKTEIPEGLSEVVKPEVEKIPLEKPEYTVEGLEQLTDDQLDAMVAELPIAEAMKNLVRKIKKRSEKISQIFQLVSKK
jgi:hypothetical protein